MDSASVISRRTNSSHHRPTLNSAASVISQRTNNSHYRPTLNSAASVISRRTNNSHHRSSHLSATGSRRPTPSIRQQIERKRRRERRIRRRKTLNSGWRANLLNISLLLLSALLFFTHLNHLQKDADQKLYEPDLLLPAVVNQEMMPRIVRNGHWIAIAALCTHLISILVSSVSFFLPKITFKYLLF